MKTGSLFPVGTTTVTCTATDFAGNVGTGTFTVTVALEGDDITPPTVTASAYYNSTAAGRILSLTGVDIDHQINEWLSVSILKDGVQQATDSIVTNLCIGVGPDCHWGGMTWYIPIPEDWTAGIYDITWTTACQQGCQGYSTSSGSTSVTVPALSETAAEEEIVIPSWIKSNAGWWDDGLIDDRNYVTGLQWLITNGIMTIPPTEQGTGSDDVIPSWVKNNARWWADGSIDDRNYVTGLQWLISNGVMTIG